MVGALDNNFRCGCPRQLVLAGFVKQDDGPYTQDEQGTGRNEPADPVACRCGQVITGYQWYENAEVVAANDRYDRQYRWRKPDFRSVLFIAGLQFLSGSRLQRRQKILSGSGGTDPVSC